MGLPFELNHDTGLSWLLSSPYRSEDRDVFFDIGDRSLAIEKVEDVKSQGKLHSLWEANTSKVEFFLHSDIEVEVSRSFP